MGRLLKRNPVFCLGVGLAIGVVLGGFCPHAPLHATATDRYESFAIATGFVDEGVEAIYFLDFLTGDLRAAALSKQMPTQFNAVYQRNIIGDLAVDTSKQPRYLMVTGLADLRRGGSQLRPSSSVVYVAEITSGRVAAYAIPWDAQRHAAGQFFAGPLMLLAATSFRTAAVREQ